MACARRLPFPSATPQPPAVPGDATRQAVSSPARATTYAYCSALLYSRGRPSSERGRERERSQEETHNRARARSRIEPAGRKQAWLGMEKMMMLQRQGQEEQETRLHASTCPPWLQTAIAGDLSLHLFSSLEISPPSSRACRPLFPLLFTRLARVIDRTRARPLQ